MRGRALPLLPPLLLWLHALPPAPAAFAAASAAHLTPRNAPATATSTAPAPDAELDDAPANDSLLLVTPEPDLRNLTEGVPSGDPDPGGGGSPVPRGSSWGPRRDPLYIVIPMTVVYAAIFVAGLLGNVGTCVVIARNRHLHTATNYYLFSLAVSDLLLLLAGLPQEVYAIWSRYPYVFGEAFCVLQSYAAETSANATVLTITAFTVERYVAICHPFQAHAMSRLSRAVRFVLCIWLLALGLAVPQASQFGVVLERRADGTVLDADHAMCSVKRVLIPHAFEVSTFVFFVAPMTLITVLYVLIALKLRGSRVLAEGRRDACGSVRLKHGSSLRGPTSRGPGSRGPASCGGGGEAGADAAAANGRKNFSARGGPAHSAASRHVVKMLVAVVVAFFICWAPFHAQRLLAVYAYDPSLKPGHATVLLYQTLTYVSGVLYYLSTTVNPVLYHIMSHKFREAFKATLARYLGRGRRGRSAEEEAPCKELIWRDDRLNWQQDGSRV